jgi:hypothetical protein
MNNAVKVLANQTIVFHTQRSEQQPIRMKRGQLVMLARMQEQRERRQEAARAAFEEYIAAHPEGIDYLGCVYYMADAVKQAEQRFNLTEQQ